VLIQPVDRKEFVERTFPREYSVMVYTENGHVYAKDEKGSIICQDSPTACIQEAVNYIAQLGGGRILVKRGTYYPTTSVYIPDGAKLIIEGEGDSTVFRYTNPFTLFLHNPNNPTWTSVLSFRNFKVDRSGSGSNQANIIYVLYALYDEYDNITIVDDYREVGEDVGLYGRNSIVSIVKNSRFFNKAEPVWFHSYMVHIHSNYARNTSLIGFGAGHLLPESVFGYKQPPEYPLNGLVVIENNTCIDCGRTDEAYAVDNEYNNPYTYGTGIIRNNILVTHNYPTHSGFVCGYVERCIVESNTFIGSASSILGGVLVYRSRESVYILKNNYIKVDLINLGAYAPIFIDHANLFIEDNVIDINSTVNSSITFAMAMQWAKYAVLKNNFINYTFPSGYGTGYGITIEDLDSQSRDLEFVSIENNDIKVSAGRPLTVGFWGSYSVPSLLIMKNNKFYSGSSTNILISLRASNTIKAVIRDNSIEGVQGLSLYTDSGLTPTLIFNEIDMPIVEASPNISVRYRRRARVETFSGDGTTTQFSIPHNLVSTPTKVLVTPASRDATGQFYVTVDSTYIYVNYLTAPPSGTNNVVLYWYAEV